MLTLFLFGKHELGQSAHSGYRRSTLIKEAMPALAKPTSGQKFFLERPPCSFHKALLKFIFVNNLFLAVWDQLKPRFAGRPGLVERIAEP
jgi:hypothetical protein